MQLCTIATELFFRITSIFTGIYHSSDFAEEVKDSFFYATYWHAYIYSVPLMQTIFVWTGQGTDKIIKELRIIISSIFFIVAMCFPQLLVSTIIGPPAILIMLFIYGIRK